MLCQAKPLVLSWEKYIFSVQVGQN